MKTLQELADALDLSFTIQAEDFNHTLNHIRHLGASELDIFVQYLTHSDAEADKERELGRIFMFGQLFTALASFLGKLDPKYNDGAEPPLNERASIGGMMHIIVQVCPELFPDDNNGQDEWSLGEILKVLIDTRALENQDLNFTDFIKMVRSVGDTKPFTFADLLEWAKTSPEAKEITKRAAPLSKDLRQPTFIEARATVTAISDGPDLRGWKPITGALAMLHDRKGATHQVRFEPSTQLLNGWGNGTANEQMQRLETELRNLEFDAVITFMICLAGAIEQPELDTSIDGIIAAIGRDSDARRTKQMRELWRAKVWRWLLLFDSLSVIGARQGVWREPKNGDEKRKKMDAQQLYSKDALLKIIGQRGVEQGSLDNSAIPKEVTLVLGPWAREFRANRQILSEFGLLKSIAAIPRGKPSGAWAACVGLMLHQRWREQCSRAEVNRVGNEEKHLTIKFKPFTRRALLWDTLRSDHDVMAILDSDKPHRAKEYWKQAIEILKQEKIIGHYAEVESLPKSRQDWQKAWLDQPLDIRPTENMRADALQVHAAAKTARKRGRTKTAAAA